VARKNHNANKGGNSHSRGGGGWMKRGKKGKRKNGAPLTPGAMHSRTRIR